MKELTKAEEQVMLILWEKGKAFVKDIIEELPEPKPAYTTVSTIIRILEKKGVIAHEDYGNIYRYYPLFSKESYAESMMSGFVKNYFSNSFSHLVSFFAKNERLSAEELEEIKKIINKDINKSGE